jgi:hypothetical protein
MATSLENQGLSTVFTHLLTMKSKQPPSVHDKNSLYFKYVKEMVYKNSNNLNKFLKNC